MEIKKIKFILRILLLIVFSLLAKNVFAIEHIDYKKHITVDCTDNVFVNFDTDTFDEPVNIECRKVDDEEIDKLLNTDQIVGPVYRVRVTLLDASLEYDFFRKESTISYPKDLVSDKNYLTKDLSLFFYDDIKNDWFSYSTTDHSSNYQGKLMHTGYFTLAEKVSNNTDDRYAPIALFASFLLAIVFTIYAIIKK